MGGMFAGIPQEALIIAGLSGPEGGMKFLAPFMTQSPIEVMGPNGPMFVSPWQARGLPSPKTTLDIRKDDRDERQFDFDKKHKLSVFGLDSAKAQSEIYNRNLVPGQDGRMVPNTGLATQGAAADAAKQDIDALGKSRDAAGIAIQSIANLHRARELIDKGIVTGVGADFRVALGNALKTYGILDVGDAVSNTEAFKGAIGQEVLNVLRQTRPATDQDRIFAEKLIGGNVALTEESLRKLIDIGERVARETITRHNSRARPYIDNEQFTPEWRKNLGVQEPGPYTASPKPAPPASSVTVPMPGATGRPWERFK